MLKKTRKRIRKLFGMKDKNSRKINKNTKKQKSTMKSQTVKDNKPEQKKVNKIGNLLHLNSPYNTNTRESRRNKSRNMSKTMKALKNVFTFKENEKKTQTSLKNVFGDVPTQEERNEFSQAINKYVANKNEKLQKKKHEKDLFVALQPERPKKIKIYNDDLIDLSKESNRLKLNSTVNAEMKKMNKKQYVKILKHRRNFHSLSHKEIIDDIESMKEKLIKLLKSEDKSIIRFFNLFQYIFGTYAKLRKRFSKLYVSNNDIESKIPKSDEEFVEYTFYNDILSFHRGDFKEKGFIYDNLIMYDIPKDNTTYLIKRYVDLL